jgi:hypothetical protein
VTGVQTCALPISKILLYTSIQILIFVIFLLDRMGWYGLDRSGSEYGPGEGSCEHGNETSGFIKRWEVVRVAAQLAASQKGLSSMIG